VGTEARTADGVRADLEVAVVLGTRAEAVALAPVVRAMRRTAGMRPFVVSTGQDDRLLDQVLRPLGVRPDVDLAVPGRREPLRRITAGVVEQLGELLATRRPDAVLVHGDSTTAFGGALAAFSEAIPVGHVGAGVRAASDASFPEEANRRLITPLARWHFAPTAAAAAALLGEGVDPQCVTVSGSTTVDALLWAADLGRGSSAFAGRRSAGPRARRVLAGLRPGAGRPGSRTAQALAELAADGADVVLLLREGPDGGGPDGEGPDGEGPDGGGPDGEGPDGGGPDGGGPDGEGPPHGVRVVGPLEYLDFVATLADACLVVTDAGGLQEEAPSLGKPVLVVRDGTDRPEGVAAGVARLVGADAQALLAACRLLLSDASAHGAMVSPVSPYGDGRASQRVVHALLTGLGHHVVAAPDPPPDTASDTGPGQGAGEGPGPATVPLVLPPVGPPPSARGARRERSALVG